MKDDTDEKKLDSPENALIADACNVNLIESFVRAKNARFCSLWISFPKVYIFNIQEPIAQYQG